MVFVRSSPKSGMSDLLGPRSGPESTGPDRSQKCRSESGPDSGPGPFLHTPTDDHLTNYNHGLIDLFVQLFVVFCLLEVRYSLCLQFFYASGEWVTVGELVLAISDGGVAGNGRWPMGDVKRVRDGVDCLVVKVGVVMKRGKRWEWWTWWFNDKILR